MATNRQIAFTEYNVAQEKKHKAKREVNFKSNKLDKLCVILVANGRSNKLVRKLCGPKYSDGVIRYRCALADISRADYRDGIARPYTQMTLGIEKTPLFQDAMDDYLRRVVPHMYKVVNINK